MEQGKYKTNKYVLLRILGKSHEFFLVPKDFPLIEDDILDLSCLEKYRYEISNETLKLDNNTLHFQKPTVIQSEEKRVRTIYIEEQPARVCFFNTGEKNHEIFNYIENNKDLD